MSHAMCRMWIVATGLLVILSGARLTAAELLGSALRINVNETTGERVPNAATNGVDRTLVVYRGYTPNYGGIIGQFFDLTGHAITGEFIAMDYPVNTPFEQAYGFRKPVAGVDASGNGVVAWEAGDILDQPDGSCTGIYAQRIDATGARIGSPFQVNTSTSGCQVEPQLAVQPDGSFLIAWSHANGFGSNPGVFARRYDSGGAPQGNDFRIGSAVNADDADPALLDRRQRELRVRLDQPERPPVSPHHGDGRGGDAAGDGGRCHRTAIARGGHRHWQRAGRVAEAHRPGRAHDHGPPLRRDGRRQRTGAPASTRCRCATVPTKRTSRSTGSPSS